MLKVGTIGFGGGSALIPVLHRELVESEEQTRYKLTDAEFTHDTVIANVTPGALPVKLAAQAGSRLWGFSASVVGAMSVALPGTLLTVCLLFLFTRFSGGVIRVIEYASLGVSAFIVFLLLHYVGRVLAPAGRPNRVSIVIAVVAFAVTGAGPTITLIHRIAGSDQRYAIPTLSALGLVVGSLTLIAIVTLFQTVRGRKVIASEEVSLPSSRRVMRAALGFCAIAVFGFLLALTISPRAETARFFGLIAASAASSFGGGEAYVGVADSTFIASGIESRTVFYGQIVPVANALPGPILVKIASGLGFTVGTTHGGALIGGVFSIAALMISVGISCAIALSLLAVYSRASKLLLVHNIARFILPTICGLLVSTCVSLLSSSVTIAEAAAVPAVITVAAVLLMSAVAWILKARVAAADLVLIGGFAVLSAAVLTLLSPS